MLPKPSLLFIIIYWMQYWSKGIPKEFIRPFQNLPPTVDKVPQEPHSVMFHFPQVPTIIKCNTSEFTKLFIGIGKRRKYPEVTAATLAIVLYFTKQNPLIKYIHSQHLGLDPNLYTKGFLLYVRPLLKHFRRALSNSAVHLYQKYGLKYRHLRHLSYSHKGQHQSPHLCQ